MAKKRTSRRGNRSRPSRPESSESRTAQTLTIAWTVSVTGVVIADLMLLAARFLAAHNPDARQLQMLDNVLLLLAAGMGIVSLALLAAAWRSRTVQPPPGYVAFAALAAAAPIAALLGRLVAG
jgi:hypothetical protein